MTTTWPQDLLHWPKVQRRPKRHNEGNERAVRRLSRRSVTEECPHHEPEIERGDMGDVALAHVVASTQTHASVRARLAGEGEGALDSLAA
jgi:hypothetical protein